MGTIAKIGAILLEAVMASLYHKVSCHCMGRVWQWWQGCSTSVEEIKRNLRLCHRHRSCVVWLWGKCARICKIISTQKVYFTKLM